MDYYTQELGFGCPECGPSGSSSTDQDPKKSTAPAAATIIPVTTSPDYYTSLLSPNEAAAKGKTSVTAITPPVNKILPEPKKEVIQQVRPLPVVPAAICDDTGLLIATGGFAMMFLIAAAIHSE